RLGWWPPYGRGYRGFVQVMSQICRGICLIQRAVREVEPDSIFVHVDATDLYEAAHPGDPAEEELASLRQEIVFLALDLVMGRVGSAHGLSQWLATYGLADADLAWFRDHAVRPDLIGC